MKIQLNSDKNIQVSEKLEAFVSEKINRSLKRFDNKITRIEVHLSDQNAGKSGADDMQCRIEARIKDLQPVTVTARNSTKEKALGDAIDKIKAALDSAMGKLTSK
ncbi:MAG: ribosome-associated translation inhibitor RaiA [Bacteroidales bacterium]